MKQTDKKGDKNKVGAWGETIAANYLKRSGFSIVDVNYLKKWGEIDIVARKTNCIHFVEVKTVSYETKNALNLAISRATHLPEENVHYQKLRRLERAIDSWLLENSCDLEWQIDVVAVRIVPREKYATVKYLPNVIQ